MTRHSAATDERYRKRMPSLEDAIGQKANENSPASRGLSHQHCRAYLLLGLAFLIQLEFFGFIALHRFVDADEGFFLLASRLVLAGKKPYVDFLFEQAPLLPYVYALFMKCFGISWVGTKMFAAALTAAVGTLVCEDVWHHTQRRMIASIAVIMFASSTLVFGFYPVVKTYSLAGLLVFAAYTLTSRVDPSTPKWPLVASGICFGLSIEARSYLLLLAPLFLYWIFQHSEPLRRSRNISCFIAGTAVALLLSLYIFVLSPSAFLFSNLRYHALRSDAGLIGSWREKLMALILTFVGGPESNGVQASVLFFICLGFVFSLRTSKYRPRFAFQLAVAIGIISLLPTPVHPQYFCLCVPFLLVSAVCVVSDLISEVQPGRNKLIASVACLATLLIYLASAANDFRRYLATGNQVPGVDLSVDNGDWTLPRILEVSQAVDQVAAAGETVASCWPGFIFQTRALPLPGQEADYALLIADKLNPDQRQKYHIISTVDIEADFRAHFPRVVVLRDHIPPKGGKQWRELLRTEDSFRAILVSHNYEKIRSIGGISIYVWSPRS